jgi:hypothetical protein
MTPDEAAAIALAFAALSDATTATVDRRSTIKVDRSIGRSLHPSWSTIDEPRTWMGFARRDALASDIDV